MILFGTDGVRNTQSVRVNISITVSIEHGTNHIEMIRVVLNTMTFEFEQL